MKRILLFIAGIVMLVACDLTVDKDITSQYLIDGIANGNLDVYLKETQIFRYKGKPGIDSIHIGNADLTKYERCFVLHVETGTTQETTVSSATIKLDGIEILNSSDFSKNVGRKYTFEVCDLTSTSLLMVEINGKPGSYLDIWIEGKLKPVIPTDGLVAYYPFNGNANDESGNGYNGNVTNAILTTDRHGNSNSAYSLDGISSLIDLGYIPISINNFSVSLWAYTKSNPGGSDVFLSNDNTVDGFDLYQHFDESIYFTIRLPFNELNILVCPFGSERLNKWNLIVATSENGLLKLYINNSLIGSTSGSLGVASTFNLGAGFEPSANVNIFNGYLDGIRIYNHVLTQQEISILYNE